MTTEQMIKSSEIVDALEKVRKKYMHDDSVSLESFAKILKAIDDISMELGVAYLYKKQYGRYLKI